MAGISSRSNAAITRSYRSFRCRERRSGDIGDAYEQFLSERKERPTDTVIAQMFSGFFCIVSREFVVERGR
jgi:hypothetical protein